MNNCKMFSAKDLIIVAPEGEMTLRSYPDIEKTISEDLNGSHKMKVVINMEKIGFLDSAGVIFLLRLKSMVTARGGYMTVYNLKNNIEKSLIKLQLDTVLNLSGNAEQCFIDLWYMSAEEAQLPAVAFKQ